MDQQEQHYNDVWKAIVENADGTINLEKLRAELFDYNSLIEGVGKVYQHVTAGSITKVNTPPDAVCRIADEQYKQRFEVILKPSPDYDFVNHDQVFCTNSDGTVDYFELVYEDESAAWVLIPYENKNFITPKKNEEGKVVAELMLHYGYDLLERVADYDFEDLD